MQNVLSASDTFGSFVESSYTIVVPDAALLPRLCGTNDSNLRLIEKYLGVPVFTRGNELTVDSSDSRIEQQFQYIIDRIIDEAQSGSDVDTDMLLSIMNIRYASELDGGLPASRRPLPREQYESACISVPGGMRRVYPRTENQAALVHAMRTHDLVFCTGPAGTGKTFLAAAEALRMLRTHEVSSVILTRPVVEAGESLGFLPGDLEQKISPYLRPLYDAMELLLPREMIRRLLDSGAIEVAPLAYMRGRTLSHSAVILDEAQNTTQEQMKMFLTRMGEKSKIFVAGDVTQIDLPKRVPSGLVQALAVLSAVPEIAVLEMTGDDVVRHPLVKKIVQAYETI